MKQKTKTIWFVISSIITVIGFWLISFARALYQKGTIKEDTSIMLVMLSMLVAAFATIASVSFLIYFFVKDKNGEAVMRKPRISLKVAVIILKILLVLFSLEYIFIFINPLPQKMEIIFGIVGFFYFYFLYIVAAHLFIDGIITKKPATMFWLAFFSSAVPLVHLIAPIWLLRRVKQKRKVQL